MPPLRPFSYRSFSRLLAGCLILVLAQDPVVLLAAPRHSESRPRAGKSLTEEQRAEHALDRLTFGPRPGDVQRVEAMGVKAWIAMQLDPEQIDDSLLQRKLQNYPAMRLSQAELMQKFPSAEAVRAIADGKLALPQDRVERAIYQNQVADYEARKQKQAEAAAQSAPATAGSEQTAGMAPQPEAPLAPAQSAAALTANEQRLYSDLAATQIVSLPPDQRLSTLENMHSDDFRDFVKGLTREERGQLTDGMTPEQTETIFALLNPTLLVSGELMQARLLTDVYSQRQLAAVMTDFWLNHFNVYLKKGPWMPWYLVNYQQNVIAPLAMGKFEDLLDAVAKTPALLFYLDNQSSIGPQSIAAVRAQMNPKNRNRDLGLNENFARELMELHTLGVDGGYTQKDVTEVAKVFTGWTIENPQQGGGFVFNEKRHQPGAKLVLGQTIPENGEQEGLQVLHMLAMSPATAHHLSQQLAVRFVSDNPPAALVDRMASTYLRTGGDIREVLRTMFTSPEFWSKDAYLAKVKTPEEFVISAIRASDGQVVRPTIVLGALNQLGMPFFGCQTPNGYAWTAAAWVNTGDLLDRMNIAMALANHRLGTLTDMDALLQIDDPGAAPPNEKEARLEQVLLGEPVNQKTRDAILQQADETLGQQPFHDSGAVPQRDTQKGPGLPRGAALLQIMDVATPIAKPTDKQAALMAGLLLGSPEFQRK